MQDTTVSGIRHASYSGPNVRRRFSGRPVRRSGEDELLARVLITSWSLNTGRTPPQSFTEEELIRFWADDLIATPSADPGCQRPGR
jgi:hypothetical protein